MRVENKHTATLTIGRVQIGPGESAEISADAAKLSGVLTWLKSGKLAEVKAPAKKADDK